MEAKSIPTHFGDIMSQRETQITFPLNFTPLERILLTANGNVQRILSALFNAKITVNIIKNNLKHPENLDLLEENFEKVLFDRHVQLCVHEKICCDAYSTIEIKSRRILNLIIHEQVGIGQLFRYLSILPDFRLEKIDKSTKSFSREYVLESPGICCKIKEIFPCEMLENALLSREQ